MGRGLGEASVAAIVVGETAGALYGWPLSLHSEGGIDLLVGSGDSEAVREVFAAAALAEGVRVCEVLPGTWDYLATRPPRLGRRHRSPAHTRRQPMGDKQLPVPGPHGGRVHGGMPLP
jgi:hypothetical protein